MNRVRAAMTETCNVYEDMPASVANLPELAGRLDDIRQANLSHHVELIGAAAAQGAHIIGLGELFAAPYFALHRHEFWRDMAESAADGPTVTNGANPVSAAPTMANPTTRLRLAPVDMTCFSPNFLVIEFASGKVLDAGRYSETRVLSTWPF